MASVSQLPSSLFTASGDPCTAAPKGGKASLFATTLAGIGATTPTTDKGSSKSGDAAPLDRDASAQETPPDPTSVASGVTSTANQDIAMQIDQAAATPGAPGAPAPNGKPTAGFTLDDMPAAAPPTLPAKPVALGKDDARDATDSPVEDQNEPVSAETKPDEHGKRSSLEDAVVVGMPVMMEVPSAPAVVDAAVQPKPQVARSMPPRGNTPASVALGRANDPAPTAPSTQDAEPTQPIAPALAALVEVAAAAEKSDRASAGQIDPKDAAPSSIPTPFVSRAAPPPTPATAAIMTARAAATPVVRPAEAKAERPADKAAGDSDAQDIGQADLASPPNSPSAAPAPATPHMPAPTIATAPSAGQQLAAGTADRQLDLARQGAWLDGLARDIATAGSSSGTLRFQVAPQHLGAVQVELRQGVDGATVTLTASSEASRSLLDQAKPQLVAEARTHGISIASAQVDVGHGDARPGSDSQQGNGRSPDPRPDSRPDTGFSSQAGGQSSGNGRSQTHSQPIAVNQDHERRANAPAREAEANSSPARDDGLYA